MEQKVRIVLTERAGVAAAQLMRRLPQLCPQAQVVTIAALSAFDTEKLPDVLIVGCGEREEACGLMSASHGVLLVLGTREEAENCLPSCVANGVLCAAREEIASVLPLALAMSARLCSLRVREHTLQRQLTDTKLVGRAKLLLMTRLQMSEAEAHRYIEKTAMDNAETRRDVALRLIRTYEE